MSTKLHRWHRLVALSLAAMLSAFPQAIAAQTTTAPALVVPAPSASGTRVVVPGGTVVTVVVSDKISSATANVGDTFAFQAATDVFSNGWLVIAKGAPGQGEILSVQRAGSHGHAGSLGVQYDWIFDVAGDKVKLTNQKNTEEGKGEAGVSSTMTILSWALLGPVGLFAHNWVKGHDVEIDDTHPLKAYVDDSVYVVATARAEAEPGFAPAVASNDAAPVVPPSSASSRNTHAVATTTASSSSTAVMAPAAPAAYAQPVTTAAIVNPNGSQSGPALAAGTPTTGTVLELSGSAPTFSSRFTTTAEWAVSWSYDCAQATGSTFSLSVEGGTTLPAIAPTQTAGAAITRFTNPGSYYLKIDSACSWHVRAFNESPATATSN